MRKEVTIIPAKEEAFFYTSKGSKYPTLELCAKAEMSEILYDYLVTEVDYRHIAAVSEAVFEDWDILEKAMSRYKELSN